MWNYRVCKRKIEDGSIVEFSIREVYYNEDNSIHAYSTVPLSFTQAEHLAEENKKEAIETFKFDAEAAIRALEKDVLDLDEIDLTFEKIK